MGGGAGQSSMGPAAVGGEVVQVRIPRLCQPWWWWWWYGSCVVPSPTFRAAVRSTPSILLLLMLGGMNGGVRERLCMRLLVIMVVTSPIQYHVS